MRNLFDTFIDDAEIVELNITKGNDKIRVNNMRWTIMEFFDKYHDAKDASRLTKELRTALYAKFGEEYAKDYLLG